MMGGSRLSLITRFFQFNSLVQIWLTNNKGRPWKAMCKTWGGVWLSFSELTTKCVQTQLLSYCHASMVACAVPDEMD